MIRTRLHPLARVLPLLASALATPAGATGYRVSPMIYELAPSGQKATTLLRVQNDSDKPITIELVAEKRDFDTNGVEKRVPADDDFVLFPPQAVVAAGATQAVRVQYIGKPDIATSETYTVTIKQLPVALAADGATGVQFMFNFSTLANIVPARAEAAVTVSEVRRTPEGALQLLLHNSGTKFASIAGAKVTLASASQSYLVPADEWRKALGSSWLLPGHDRLVTLPAALPAPKDAAKASVELAAASY